MCAGDSPWDIHGGAASQITSAIPLGDVLTLPATAARPNVITPGKAPEILCQRPVFPKFSILTETIYPAGKASNGIDAYMYVIEQYLTYPIGAIAGPPAEALLLSRPLPPPR